MLSMPMIEYAPVLPTAQAVERAVRLVELFPSAVAKTSGTERVSVTFTALAFEVAAPVSGVKMPASESHPPNTRSVAGVRMTDEPSQVFAAAAETAAVWAASVPLESDA